MRGKKTNQKKLNVNRLQWKQAINHFGPYIHRKARKITSQLPSYLSRNLYEDLVGVGFRGFVEAMHRLDPDRKESMEPYVRKIVTGAMLDELRRLDPLSRDQRRQQRGLRTIEQHLTAVLGRPPSEDEMATASKKSLDEFQKASAESTPVVLSLDAPLAGSEGEALVNTLCNKNSPDPQREVMMDERRSKVYEAVRRLPTAQRTVVERYYYRGDTLEAIGNGLNVCAARASQIRKEAVECLRRKLAEAC